jgi:hypothetical protein
MWGCRAASWKQWAAAVPIPARQIKWLMRPVRRGRPILTAKNWIPPPHTFHSQLEKDQKWFDGTNDGTTDGRTDDMLISHLDAGMRCAQSTPLLSRAGRSPGGRPWTDKCPARAKLG